MSATAAPLPDSLLIGLVREAWGGVGDTLATRLLAETRLAPRVRSLALAYVADEATALASLDDEERILLAAVAAEPQRAALIAGCAWHAAAVLSILRGQDLGRLADQLGFDPRPPACAARGLSRASPPADLAEAIRRDGPAVITAWLEARPAPIAARLRLSLAPALAALIVVTDPPEPAAAGAVLRALVREGVIS